MIDYANIADLYKILHSEMYPNNTTNIFSYYEARKEGFGPDVVFCGLQSILQTLNEAFWNYENYLPHDLSRFGVKNLSKFEQLNKLEGWPVRIKALPEGWTIPVSNVLLTIENTKPEFYWVTSYLETLISHLWFPCTVASLSREIKKVCKKYLELTGNLSCLGTMLHDFGMRGVSSYQSAQIGGMAHLINFDGTDNLAATSFVKEIYGEDVGCSIAASEHSVVCAYGRDHEIDCYRKMLSIDGPVSIVIDSYNWKSAVAMFCTDLRDDVLKRKDITVLRPDSGEPLEIIPAIFDSLAQYYGKTLNSKGFNVLNKFKILWGDGIDKSKIEDILSETTDAGMSADNFVFGCGGGLLQKVNRDNYGFAFKCSSAVINGEQRDVYKDPIDGSKKSKRGRLKLIYKNGYKTVREDEEPNYANLLETVYEDGKILKTEKFSDIRRRADV